MCVESLLYRLGHKKPAAEVLLLLISIAASGPLDSMWWLARDLPSPEKVPLVSSRSAGFVNRYDIVDVILTLVAEDLHSDPHFITY